MKSCYIFTLFLFFIFYLSIIFACVSGSICLILALIITINVIQTKRPNLLPKKLQTWDCLPKCLHSLEPYDNFFRHCSFKRLFTKKVANSKEFEIHERVHETIQNPDEKNLIIILDSSNLYRIGKLNVLRNNESIK